MLYLKHLWYIHTQFIDSFRISNNGKIPKKDIILFFVIPFIVGFIMANSAGAIQTEFLITGTSIYMGFLIGMLIPFLNFIENQDNYIKLINNPSASDSTLISEKQNRLDQYRIMYSQVTYALVISVVSIVLLFIFPPLKNVLQDKTVGCIGCYVIPYGNYISRFITSLIYSFQVLNIFTLIIIIVSSNVIIYPQLKKMASVKK